QVSYARKLIFLAAAYFAAAKLALVVAIPPGYATAVWPPSGIALAAVLVPGTRMCPGSWLGATLVTVTVKSSLLAAVLIGTGYTLEALAGAALVRTFLGVHRSFQRGEDVVKFAAIAALSAAIAATVAVVPLMFVDALSSPDLRWNWWTWWQGNATGIIIVAPLVLSWSARDKETWPLPRILEAASLALPLLVCTHAIFSGGFTPAHPYSILPFIIWAAFRFRQREVARLAAIMIDVDRFKQINDTAGHSAGDLVLMEIATVLTRHIRGSDIACRYGGEEFALILPNATPDSARRRSEEICSAIRQGN